jgi:hypothetical protein
MSTTPSQDRENRVVDVFETNEESEALVLKGLLESAGIDTLMVGENADVFPVGAFFLRVTNEDADEAKRVIETSRANPPAEDEEPPAA